MVTFRAPIYAARSLSPPRQVCRQAAEAQRNSIPAGVLCVRSLVALPLVSSVSGSEPLRKAGTTAAHVLEERMYLCMTPRIRNAHFTPCRTYMLASDGTHVENGPEWTKWHHAMPLLLFLFVRAYAYVCIYVAVALVARLRRGRSCRDVGTTVIQQQ